MEESRKVLTSVPENSETPLEKVCSWVTPNRLFFVRDHFQVPRIDLQSWRLSIEGCVRRPKQWTWDELTALPSRSVFATVECAGNGRSFLQPAVEGVQWGAGAIGHAEWTGVPLKWLLDEVGIAEDAVEAVFVGADEGCEPDHPQPMPFTRSLPLDKALHPDTLLAYRMNGELFEPDHGYPLRLFVPGWYGVASVKWLTRIELVRKPFQGYFQTRKYTYRERISDGLTTKVVGPMVVKSEIIRPHPGEVLGAGKNRIFGVAWAGEDRVKAVEVSVDGGRSWQQAELLGQPAEYCWCLWEYLWEEYTAGSFSILARAVSSRGGTQPEQHDPLRGGYMINFLRPREIRIEPSRVSSDRQYDAEAIVYDMNAYAEEISRTPLDVEMEYSEGAGI